MLRMNLILLSLPHFLSRPSYWELLLRQQIQALLIAHALIPGFVGKTSRSRALQLTSAPPALTPPQALESLSRVRRARKMRLFSFLH